MTGNSFFLLAMDAEKSIMCVPSVQFHIHIGDSCRLQLQDNSLYT